MLRKGVEASGGKLEEYYVFKNHACTSNDQLKISPSHATVPVPHNNHVITSANDLRRLREMRAN